MQMSPQSPRLGGLDPRPAGFPLRQNALDVPGFSTAGTQGMRGGELPECPGTVIPGSCAFNELADAAFVCLFLQPNCNAMVVYPRGAPGCCLLARGAAITATKPELA